MKGIEELLESDKNDGYNKIKEFKDKRMKSYLKIIENDIKNIGSEPGEHFIQQTSLLVASSLNPNFWIKKFHKIYHGIIEMLKDARTDYTILLNNILEFANKRRNITKNISTFSCSNPNVDFLIFNSQLQEDETEKIQVYYQKNCRINIQEKLQEILSKVLLIDSDFQNLSLFLKFVQKKGLL